MGEMRKIDEAIIAGDYATFVNLASTSPFKSITQDTFNQLVPQFKAKQAAETQIKAILESAGIKFPDRGQAPPKTN
jgi:signal transduction histidine kinase